MLIRRRRARSSSPPPPPSPGLAPPGLAPGAPAFDMSVALIVKCAPPHGLAPQRWAAQLAEIRVLPEVTR